MLHNFYSLRREANLRGALRSQLAAQHTRNVELNDRLDAIETRDPLAPQAQA